MNLIIKFRLNFLYARVRGNHLRKPGTLKANILIKEKNHLNLGGIILFLLIYLFFLSLFFSTYFNYYTKYKQKYTFSRRENLFYRYNLLERIIIGRCSPSLRYTEGNVY